MSYSATGAESLSLGLKPVTETGRSPLTLLCLAGALHEGDSLSAISPPRLHCRRSFLQQISAFDNVAGPARCLGIDRDRQCGLKQDVALDPETERQARRGEFGKAAGAQLRTSEAEIGKAEQRVAVRLHLGDEPGARADGIEEFHHGHMIDIALPPIGEQPVAQIVGQQDHATLLSQAGSPAIAWPASSGAKARSQSAALPALLAARTMARLSSRNTSSQEAM